MQDDWNCYNPVNMMTRQLAPSCRAQGQEKFSPHHRPERSEADLHEALRRLKSETFFVGLTELYQESLCVLHYKVHDKLPDNCNCEDKTRWATFQTTRTYFGKLRMSNELPSTEHIVCTSFAHNCKLKLK